MKALKVNQEITADRLLLIDDEGKSLGVVSFDQAMYLAYEKGFDLVELNPNSNPPVARLMDYGKYLYNQTKQESKQRAQAKSGELKEVRFGIKIDEHDLNVKINKIRGFLEKGHRVKVTVQLRGREMMFRDRAGELLDRVKTEADARFEGPIDRMGNRFFVTLIKNK